MSYGNFSKFNKFIKNLIFSLIIISIIFALLEISLRISGIPSNKVNDSELLPIWVISNIENSNFIPDRVLFWRVPFSEKRLFTNSKGLRGEEFSIHKEKNVFRIITMGDSCTWGFGVKPGQEYPKILQDLLNMTYIPLIFEVENAGVPGYSSLQGLRYLKTELIKYEPDIITIYFGRNDARKLNEEGGYTPDHEIEIQSKFVYNLKKLLNKFNTYRLIRDITFRISSKIKSSTYQSKRGSSKRKNRIHRVEADEFDNNINKIIDLAQKNNIVPILITAPVFPESVGNYNEIVRKISKERKILMIDAATEFKKHDGNGWLVDDCHPNVKGHKWLANQLKNLIIKIARKRISANF